MWNLLKWFSSPSKKEEAAMKAAMHHAREKREAAKMAQSASHIGALPTGRDETSRANFATLENTVDGAHESYAPPVDSAYEQESARAGRDLFSAAKTPRESGLRRNAMAYWRKNTNSERPSDSHYYTDLTSASAYDWQNPLADAASSNKKAVKGGSMIGSDLSSLSAFLTCNSKNYLAGMYARKSQCEVQGQEFDSLKSAKNEVTSQDLASYPHYKGEWQPEIAQTPVTQSALTANLFSAAADALNERRALDFAIPVEEDTASAVTSVGESAVDEYSDDFRTNHAWTLSAVSGSPTASEPEVQALNEELTESLNSIESSPQCDLLFEQSAAAAGAIFRGAKPMQTLDVTLPAASLDAMRVTDSINEIKREDEAGDNFANTGNLEPSFPFVAQSQAEQSITLDSLPPQQFVDIRIAAADSGETSPEILRALAYDVNPDVRFAIAENHNVDQEILSILTADENPYVAHRARKTLQRIEGGQVKQGNFVQTRSSNSMADRRKSMS
jgi:hypothetical protein